jgi:hypothetical protein
MALDVQTVAQSQRLELVFAQLARDEAARLVAELCHPLIHERLIDGVVSIHRPRLYSPWCLRRK